MRMTKEERAARAEQRKQARAEAWRQEMDDKKLMIDALRDVIADKNTDPTIRTFAVYCLNHACRYSVLPYNLEFPDGKDNGQDDHTLDRLRVKFAEEIKAAENST